MLVVVDDGDKGDRKGRKLKEKGREGQGRTETRTEEGLQKGC